MRTLGRGELFRPFYSPFYFLINYGANTIKMIVYIQIAESEYLQTIFFQYFGSNCVFLFFIRFIVSTAVKLNHQLCGETVKINNKSINTLLPLKAYRIIS